MEAQSSTNKHFLSTKELSSWLNDLVRQGGDTAQSCDRQTFCKPLSSGHCRPANGADDSAYLRTSLSIVRDGDCVSKEMYGLPHCCAGGQQNIAGHMSQAPAQNCPCDGERAQNPGIWSLDYHYSGRCDRVTSVVSFSEAIPNDQIAYQILRYAV